MNNVGKLTNYIIKCVCTSCAVLYLILIIKESPKTTEKEDVTKTKRFIKDMLIDPLIDMFKAMFKLRPNKIHLLVGLQFFNFACYWFAIEEKPIRYLYMLKTFQGFDASDYSWFFAYGQGVF